jgi:hypothetical protein
MAEFEDELDSVVPQKKAAVKPATKPAADELEEEVEEPKKHSAKASSDDFIEDMYASWTTKSLQPRVMVSTVFARRRARQSVSPSFLSSP